MTFKVLLIMNQMALLSPELILIFGAKISVFILKHQYQYAKISVFILKHQYQISPFRMSMANSNSLKSF